MATLYVENVPEDLYAALRKRARKNRSSIAAEVLQLLEQFVPTEALVGEARELLLQSVMGKIQVIVPDLFWVELGNVLWKAVRTGRVTRTVAESGLGEVKQQGLMTTSSYRLIEAAMEIALRFNRTVYDSVYVALAQRQTIQLITADEKLANALAGKFPVKWLGAL
jgi:predicted nucleic acid-binding protein